MNLKTGDRVKFLNEIGGGVVTSVIDKNRVMVRTTDGFEIPVQMSDVIPDFDSSGYSREKEQPKAKKKPELHAPAHKAATPREPEPLNTDEELLFAVEPLYKGAVLNAHLINNTSYDIHYVITTRGEDETSLFDEGRMESRTQMILREFIPSNLKEIVRFELQIIFFRKVFFVPKEPVVSALFMDPSEVYSGKALVDSDYIDGKSLIFSVVNFRKKAGFQVRGGTNLTGMLKDRNTSDSPEKPDKASKKAGDVPEEIDLHIEAITESFSGLTNSEILDMQMSRFKIALDTAIIHKTRKIVFIHGVGNGKLKHTLRKALDDQYPDLRYQDASFREYGYGATMVIIP
jgi:hypothetical protein